MGKGFIHIYFGPGKGKTTAAFGQLLRMKGYDKKALICQLLKSEDSGEIKAIKKFLPNVHVIEGLPIYGFIDDIPSYEREYVLEAQREKMRTFTETLATGDYDIAILDEVFSSGKFDVFPAKMIEQMIKEKPEKVELILTGRTPPPSVLKLCDYATNMESVKHPMGRGYIAREGIEF